VARLFSAVTVSLDGTDRDTYAAIRGLDAFDNVCAGIRACADSGLNAGIRVTLQRSNYRQLPRFIELTRQLGARQVSFLAVDVANPHAFGRTDDFTANLALGNEDLSEFERILTSVEQDYDAEFRSGFIAESPRKLRNIHQYFAKGLLSPCFFIPGPGSVGNSLVEALNAEAMVELRRTIRAGARPECATCVCSLWRDPDSLSVPQPTLKRPAYV